MSYILDALRRADSERERASIPGLHTQPVPQGSADAKAARGSRPWVWLALGVAVVLVGQGLGRWLLHDEPPPHAGPGGPPLLGAPPAAAEPQGPDGPPPGALPGPPDAAPRPSGEATLLEPPPLPDVPRKPPPTAAARTRGTPAAGGAEPRIYAQNELPDDIRRSLPTLQIGGSVYSEDPASRFLMLNGQLLHENDKPAADLVLERIELKSAVLNYKGYRYRISY